MSETDDIIKRIQQQPGVTGSIILNNDGIPIRNTGLDNATAVQTASHVHAITSKARSSVRDMDPQNDVVFIRIRTKKDELMIAPDKDYIMAVIQNPNATS